MDRTLYHRPRSHRRTIIEYYGARWKIEAGFKEIKQEIGSSKSQTRNCYAVTNHLNFCMMAAPITWIYARVNLFTNQS
jgi:hypothetical protein